MFCSFLLQSVELVFVFCKVLYFYNKKSSRESAEQVCPFELLTLPGRAEKQVFHQPFPRSVAASWERSPATEPPDLRASTPRIRPAGGVSEKATANSQDKLRRSNRIRSNTEPTPPSVAGNRKESGRKNMAVSLGPQQWGVRGPRESLAIFGTRMQAKLAEYEQLGKKLKSLREDIKFARYQVDHSAKAVRAGYAKRVCELKAEVEEVVTARMNIVEGAGMFKEKLQNEDRFNSMRTPEEEEESQGRECLSDMEVKMEEGGEGDESEGDVSVTPCTPMTSVTPSEDYINPAQVALPVSSEDDDDCSDSQVNGGLLRAIVRQESPARLENFSFGQDLGPEENIMKKKAKKNSKKKKKAEQVSFVFSPFQQSGPAEKLSQAAGPPRLPDPFSAVEGGQHGGYSAASKMAAGATGDAKRPAGRDEQDGHMMGASGVAGPPQGGGGCAPAPELSYAAVCMGSGSPGIVGRDTDAAGHSPVRGGSVRAPELGANVICSGGGPPGVAGAAGISPVREGSPCMSMARGGGAEVRSEGQSPPLRVTSVESVISAPAEEIKGAVKNLLKPASLKFVPASSVIAESNTVDDTVNARSANDGSSSVMDERVACVISGSSSGVNVGGDSGVNVRSNNGVDGRDSSNVDGRGGSGVNRRSVSSVDGRSSSRVDGRSVGGVCGSVSSSSQGMGSGSGPAAPPVARSYASVAAGGSAGSLPPGSGDGQLQRRLLEALRRGERTLQVEGREMDLSFWVERHGLCAFRESNGETVWSLQTPRQEAGRMNVARLVWKGKDACPQSGKVVELLFQMGFRARDIFALIHPSGPSEYETVNEEEEAGQTIKDGQKKKRKRKGKRKVAPSSSSAVASDHKRNILVSDPLIFLSNRY